MRHKSGALLVFGGVLISVIVSSSEFSDLTINGPLVVQMLRGFNKEPPHASFQTHCTKIANLKRNLDDLSVFIFYYTEQVFNILLILATLPSVQRTTPTMLEKTMLQIMNFLMWTASGALYGDGAQDMK